MHLQINPGVPQTPYAPTQQAQVEPHPSFGTTASVNPNAGPVGAVGTAPTMGKTFGDNTMDTRLYRDPVPFQGWVAGPGTTVNPSAGFDGRSGAPFPELGNTTTATPGYPNLSPSGTGIKDQPASKPLGSGGSGSIANPRERNETVSQALARFRKGSQQ